MLLSLGYPHVREHVQKNQLDIFAKKTKYLKKIKVEIFLPHPVHEKVTNICICMYLYVFVTYSRNIPIIECLSEENLKYYLLRI